MIKQTQNKSQKVMDKYIKLSCISILDELEKHPISKIFAEPVDPVADEAPNYFVIVEKPMDFSTIRKKIQNDQYSTVHDFKNDVQLVFSNAVLYNGKSSAIANVAAELSICFKELSKNINDNPDVCWYNKLVQLKKMLINHVQQHPSNCQKPKEQTNDSEASKTCEIGKFEVNLMNGKELESLALNLLKMNEPKQLMNIKRIIKEENPEIDVEDGATVDLNLLSPKALRKLKEFTQNELEMIGQDYE